MAPLFFHHIPKTAGTSLVEEIRQHYAPAEIFSEDGNLSLGALREMGGAKLRALGLIYGHPGEGAAAYLHDIAETVTLLREPRAHAISNYLHMLRETAAPLHKIAKELGFGDFLRTYPSHLTFQTSSLAVGIGATGTFHERVMAVLKYLSSLALVGTVERIDEFARDLAQMRRWPVPRPLPRLNTAAQSGWAIDYERAAGEYDAIERDPRFAPRVAFERAAYAHAQGVALEQRERIFLRDVAPGGRCVHCSELGEIVLGGNFGRRELVEGRDAWWTLEQQESRIHVLPKEAASLRAEIEVWHAAPADGIRFWAGGMRLDAKVEATNGGGRIAVSLTELPRGVTTPISMRVARLDTPYDPPWYPAILLSGFRLSASAFDA